MRKIYFFGTGLLLLCLAGWGIYQVSRPHRNVAGDPAIARLSATNLYNEFLKTESLANKKWVGRVIEISGTISSVYETGKYVAISLRATDDGEVNCSFLKKDLQTEDNLSKGDSIIIKGMCTGFLMDVNMVDCIVKK